MLLWKLLKVGTMDIIVPNQTRTNITGQIVSNPTSFSEFTPQQRSELTTLIRKIVAKMLDVAALLRAQNEGGKDLLILIEENPNLFLLAAQHYGDVRGWKKIMEKSEVEESVMSGERTIKIPRG